MDASRMREEEEEDQPVTPAGRYFLHPEMDQIINCAIGYTNDIDIETFRSQVMNSEMVQHPRFQSLCIKDKHGKQHWRKTKIDINKHVFERHVESWNQENDEEAAVNEYLADLAVSTPLGADKPLWEIHLLRKQKCFVLRLHHALGDGISLMSLFLICCSRVDAPDKLPNVGSSSKKGGGHANYLWRVVLMAWFSLIYVVMFVLRALWVKDKSTGINGGPGVELWPRKLATAKFCLDDMKLIKSAIHNATINDVLFGILSSGINRYLDLQSTKKPEAGTQITGVAMVNLRPQQGLQELSNLMKNKSGSRWGNQFGYVLLPLHRHKDVADPLEHVTKAKVMLDRKKLSLEAYFSYWIGHLVMKLLGTKIAVLLNYRVLCNTSFTISNIVGPQEEIMFAGNPLTYIRVNSTSLAHAITMHMVSYAGKAEMQILVAKDIIPEPRLLAKCLEDALLEMKEAVNATKNKESTISNGFLQHSG